MKTVAELREAIERGPSSIDTNRPGGYAYENAGFKESLDELCRRAEANERLRDAAKNVGRIRPQTSWFELDTSLKALREALAAAPSQEPVNVLNLCESRFLGLRPNELYRFTVNETCPNCVASRDLKAWPVAPSQDPNAVAVAELKAVRDGIEAVWLEFWRLPGADASVALCERLAEPVYKRINALEAPEPHKPVPVDTTRAEGDKMLRDYLAMPNRGYPLIQAVQELIRRALAPLLLVILLIAGMPAQVVRLANYGDLPATGWIRTTVDTKPQHASGEVGGARYVLGRQIGLSTWAIDVDADLAPGEQRTLDLAQASPMSWQIGPLPPDPIAFFGGWPSVAGVPLQLRGITVDGTAASMHFGVRLQGLLHVDVWALWRPDEPGLMHLEAVVCASNSTVDAATVTAANGVRLTWGDALVHVAGAGWQAALVPSGTTFGAEQARGVAATLIWVQHVSGEQWFPVLQAVARKVGAVGITKLLPDGNPVFVGNAKQWTVERYQESLRRLHTWDPALIGPSPRSGDTGSQEDQAFVRAEALHQGGLGAEQVAYFAALKILARPCHHLEHDGRIVDPTFASPRLIYWDGVPHWHTGVSPNRLGKTEWPTVEQCHGWSGPDVEHPMMNTTAAAARLIGSHAMQWELQHQSMLYFGQWTTTQGWSTTQPYAARAVGWEGINAVHLWTTLEDRVLAERVRAHWVRRYTDVIAPAWRDRDYVDVRIDDPRLGAGAWWMPWQQALGAYGLDLACAHIGPIEGRVVALRVAKAVVRDAWVQVGDRWHSRAQMAVAGGGPSDESFSYYGCSLAVAVVLRHEPNNERARAIWQQLIATPERGPSWLAPGVQ